MDNSDLHDIDIVIEATTAPVATTAALPLTAPRLDSGAHRRYQRVRTEAVLVKLRVGQGTLVATVVDISVGGFYAATTHDHMIPIGAFVELTLLQSGAEEIDVGGVVVADATHRPGLAVRFEAMNADSARRLRRLVEDQLNRLEGMNADRGVAPARPMNVAGDDASARDAELEQLRVQVSTLRAENLQLRSELRASADAVSLVGRLQLEVERLRQNASTNVGVDVAVLGDIKRDAEIAWTAIARVSDAVGKIR